MKVHTVTIDFHVASETSAEAERKLRGLIRNGFPHWPSGSVVLRGITRERQRRGGRALT